MLLLPAALRRAARCAIHIAYLCHIIFIIFDAAAVIAFIFPRFAFFFHASLSLADFFAAAADADCRFFFSIDWCFRFLFAIDYFDFLSWLLFSFTLILMLNIFFLLWGILLISSPQRRFDALSPFADSRFTMPPYVFRFRWCLLMLLFRGCHWCRFSLIYAIFFRFAADAIFLFMLPSILIAFPSMRDTLRRFIFFAMMRWLFLRHFFADFSIFYFFFDAFDVFLMPFRRRFLFGWCRLRFFFSLIVIYAFDSIFLLLLPYASRR